MSYGDPEALRARPRPAARGVRSTAPPSPVDGRPSPRAPPRQRARSTPIEPCTNVFINYIPAEFTEADLRAMCHEYGTILCSKIMINLETGQSKCFGFVRFSSLGEAKAAIDGLNGRQIGAKRLLAKYAESCEKRDRASTMLYVKRLPMSVQMSRLAELFGRFGEILDITPHVLDSVDPQFWRCVVRYQEVGAAARALAAMNNQIIAPDTRPIHVRYADETRMSGSFLLRPPPMPALIDQPDTAQLLPSFLLM